MRKWEVVTLQENTLSTLRHPIRGHTTIIPTELNQSANSIVVSDLRKCPFLDIPKLFTFLKISVHGIYAQVSYSDTN